MSYFVAMRPGDDEERRAAARRRVFEVPPLDPAFLERLSREARARKEAVKKRLLEKHPVDYPRALKAAASLKRRLGVDDEKPPSWLVGICGNIDGCGRPYVHVSLSQWPRRGGLRLGTGPDGEVPELPEKIDGIPVFVAVQGCFGEKAPGCNGEPCVPESDPVDERQEKIEKVKAAVSAHLGDLGDLSDAGPDEEASLPSGRAWVALLRHGDLSALGAALTHTGLRAALIGSGLWLSGARRDTLVRDAIAGSLGVDAFIILWSLCR